MKKLFTHKILVLSAIALALMAAGTALKNGGGAPVSHTNAPAEANCTTSGCHSGSLNPTSSNLANLTLTGTFTGNGYIPDSTYTMTLTYAQSGINRFGMELTCLTKTGSNPAGTLTAGSGSQKMTGTVTGKTREYLTHTSASSSGSRTWVFTWTAPSTNVDTVMFYVVVNAANSDGTTSGDQIYAKEFKFGPSSLLPIASIMANKTTICVGDTVKFSGSGTNSPTSYAWKFRGTPSTSSAQNPEVIYNNPGTFFDTLRVFNVKGSSAPATVKITVTSKPSANIISTLPGNTICEGDTVTVSAAFSSTNKYKWDTGNPGDTFNVVKITQGGTYRVTVTSAGGCSSVSAPVTVTVKPKPVVTITTSAVNDSVCQGDSVTYTATAGNDNYTFSVNSTTVQNSASNSIRILPASGTVVSVIAQKNGCQSSAVQKTVTVVAPAAGPTISCGTPTTSDVTFNWTTVAGATGYEVSTDTGKTWNSPSTGAAGTSHTITGLGFSTSVKLWVRANTSSLCGKSQTSNQTCATLSCSGVTYKTTIGDTLLCPGDSTTITLSDFSTSKYSIKFNNGSFASDTVFWAKPNATTNYPFEIIDSTKLNCGAAPFTVSVGVDNVPTLTATAVPGTTVCFGKTINLTSSTGFSSYTAFKNSVPTGTPNATGAFNNLTVVSGDKMTVEGQTSAGCKATSNELTFVVNPLPKPGFTATINNKSVTFDDTTTTSNIRVWTFGDNTAPVITTKNPTHNYATVGTFDVKLVVIDNNQCVDSVTKQITTTNVSVGEIAGLNGLDVYPNPTTGVLQLNINWQGNSVLTVKVTDITGKTVYTEAIEDKGAIKQTINLQHLPNGTYLLHLQSADGEKTLKVLKQDK
ncbi:MAG: T9SS type A sorting domain-containing protein [Bacteroidetes bacterium]|nr:MAG: T9SS type A sorting domain-containing protein [Bacteroidota bacterium]